MVTGVVLGFRSMIHDIANFVALIRLCRCHCIALGSGLRRLRAGSLRFVQLAQSSLSMCAGGGSWTLRSRDSPLSLQRLVPFPSLDLSNFTCKSIIFLLVLANIVYSVLSIPRIKSRDQLWN